MHLSPNLFIVGAPRSGTSFLANAVGAHPEIDVRGELRVVDIAALAGRLALHGGRPAQAADGADLRMGRGFAEAMLGELRGGAPVRWIGDKYPADAQRLPVVWFAWPDARVIHIVRDGRDVVASRLEAFANLRGWRVGATVRPAAAHAASWVVPVVEARRAALQRPEQVLEVRYEALLAEPDAVAARVCAFLGLDPHPRMLERFRRAQSTRTWRDTLSPAEQESLRAIGPFEELLARLGYAPTPPSPEAADDADGEVAAGLAAARAGRKGEAARHHLRALRLSPRHRGALAGLLALPDHPASVFAARVSAELADAGDLAPALASWAVRRGLPDADARALWGIA